MTNEEWIRSASVNDLSMFLRRITFSPFNDSTIFIEGEPLLDSQESVINWLLAERSDTE